MKYAYTDMVNNIETVVVLLPLTDVPYFDPENPPQPNAYGVPDDVKKGWIRDSNGTFSAPPTPLQPKSTGTMAA